MTVCPRSAWVYEGPVYHGPVYHGPVYHGRDRALARPAAIIVHFDPHKHYYYRKNSHGARVKIVVR